MRYLGVQDVKDIATGASLVGAGGGGDPYIGELMAVSAVKRFGKVKLLSIDEIKDQDKFVPASTMGAPSIETEIIPKGDEYKRAFVTLEKYTHQKFAGTFPVEVGGTNSMMPIVLAAQMKIPVVNCDSMGRAFPGTQMTTLAINGVSCSPACVTDEKGNVALIHSVTPDWSEKILRAICVKMGGTCTNSQYIATGQQLKRYGVHGIMDLCEKIGKIVRNVPYTKRNSLKEILNLTHGYHLFDGKVVDISHRIERGFNFGKITVHGINRFKGQTMHIDFQNENLVATRNGQVIASVPDLVCLADYDTLIPTDSEDIKYGKRISILGLPCSQKWRTPQGIRMVGPRRFGYKFDYVPIEKLIKRTTK